MDTDFAKNWIAEWPCLILPGKEAEVAEVDEEADPVLLVADITGDPGEFVVVDKAGDETAQDHLQQLQAGGQHGQRPGHPHPQGLQGVVGVHHRVDRVVHHHEQPAGGGHVDVGVEAHPHDGDVVIPVEEYQPLLAQHDEGRVEELHHLGEDEEVGPEAGHPVLRDEGGRADCPVYPAPGHHLEQLSPGAEGPGHAEHGEAAAPDGQRPPQVKRRSEVTEEG